MAALASTIIARAKVAFPEMGGTTALDLLNDAHAEFLARYPLRQDVLTIALTEDTQEYSLAETAIQIEAAYYYPDANNPRQLSVLHEHEEDTMDPGWRADSSGVPSRYYLGASLTAGVIGFHPRPNDTTISVTDATNATPIVVTSNAVHGLEDGDAVIIVDVAGNTAANGEYFAKVTGYSTTTFALYEETGLTTAVAGSGAYTSGGSLICADSPAVRLHIRRNQTLTTSDAIPSCLLSIEPYVYSICRRWAEMTMDPNDWVKWQRLEDAAVHKMELYLAERAGQSTAVLKPYYMTPRRVY